MSVVGIIFSGVEKMPRYEYACMECDFGIEVVKPFSEADSIQICEKCGHAMNKVYGTFGIHFKGGGFYSTGG